MATIYFTNGGACLVSDEDYIVLSSVRWQRHPGGYGYRCESNYPDPKVIHWMHRDILNAPKGVYVDHIDGDPANNQRENLRLCTMSENLANQRKSLTRKRTSDFKGVSRHRSGWIVRLGRLYLGWFKTETEAAEAYDAAAIARYGEFARPNISAVNRGKVE